MEITETDDELAPGESGSVKKPHSGPLEPSDDPSARLSSHSVVHIESDLLWAKVVRETATALPTLHHAGVCSTLQEGMSACRELRPDIVILDPGIGDDTSTAWLLQVRSLPKKPAVLVITSLMDDVMLFEAGCEPIAGLVSKTIDGVDHLLNAMRAVADGRKYFAPEVQDRMQQFRSSPHAFHKILTRRELDVLPGIANRWPDAVIAAQLRVSKDTVHTHRSNIMAKLQLHTAHELSLWAVSKGFGRTKPDLGSCCVG